jgi:hypothetical protein
LHLTFRLLRLIYLRIFVAGEIVICNLLGRDIC